MLNIALFLIKEIISLFNKFLNFSGVFNNGFIICNSGGTGGRRRAVSIYIRIIIIITIINIRIKIRIRITTNGLNFSSNLL